MNYIFIVKLVEQFKYILFILLKKISLMVN